MVQPLQHRPESMDGTLLKRAVVFAVAVVLVLGFGWLAMRGLAAAASSARYAATRVQFVRILAPGSKTDASLSHELEPELTAVDNIARAAEEAGAPHEEAGAIAEHLSRYLQVDIQTHDPLAEVTLALPAECGFDAASRAALLERLGSNVLADQQQRQVAAAHSAHEAIVVRLQAARQNVSRLQTRFDALLDEFPADTTAPLMLARPEPTVNEDKPPVANVTLEEQQLTEKLSRRAGLLKRLTPQHPDVIELDEEIRDLQAQIAASGTSLPREYTPSKQPDSGLKLTRPEPAPTRGISPRQLRDSRQALEVAQANLEQLTQSERKVWEQLDRAQQSSWQKLPASPASSVSLPSSTPAILLIVGVAILVGGLAAGYVRPAPTTYRQAADLHRHLGVPVLGVLPAEE